MTISLNTSLLKPIELTSVSQLSPPVWVECPNPAILPKNLNPDGIKQLSKAHGIPEIYIAAALQLNRFDSLLETYHKISMSPFYISEAESADKVRSALALPDDFFPLFWNSTALEATQWLQGACQALTLGVAIQEVQLAIRRGNLSHLLDVLAFPEKTYSSDQLRALQNSNALLQTIVDQTVYEMPLWLLANNETVRMRSQWREAYNHGMSPQFLEMMAKSETLDQLVFEIQKAKTLKLAQSDRSYLIYTSALSDFITIKQLLHPKTHLQISEYGTLLTRDQKDTGLQFSTLKELVRKASEIRTLGHAKLIEIQSRDFIVERHPLGIQLHLLSLVAAGQFGSVYKIYDMAHSIFHALKMPLLAHEESDCDITPIQSIRNEYEILNQIYKAGYEKKMISSEDQRILGLQAKPKRFFDLSHANFVGLMTPFLDYTFADLNANPDLIEKVFGSDQKNARKRYYSLCLQLFSGIKDLHALGFAHVDIKSANCGLTINQSDLQVVLFDFGLAYFVGTDSTCVCSFSDDVESAGDVLLSLLDSLENVYPEIVEGRILDIEHILKETDHPRQTAENTYLALLKLDSV